MNAEKFRDKHYIPNELTRNEVEEVYKAGESLEGFQLKKAEMINCYLVNAKMINSNLTRANFSGSSLYGVDMEGSDLFKTNFENANLKNANLKGCNLLGADFTNAKLQNIEWGIDHKVINELDAERALAADDHDTACDKYREAEDIYRSIKVSMQGQTLGDEAGIFFIREMICKRKQKSKFSLQRIWSKTIHITTGYGEKIGNIVNTVIGIILVSAILFGIDGVKYQDKILGFFSDDFGLLSTIGNLFYFSVVVYSTVGFGEIVPIGPLGKATMIFEGMIGGIVLAILIIAMYKKIMDR